MNQNPIDADAFRDFERVAHDEIAEGYRDFFTKVTGYAIEPCSTQLQWAQTLGSWMSRQVLVCSRRRLPARRFTSGH
jgi:hypothetical protein